MSDTDSFIDEVTEEVRRDRMFGLFRRYGWIAVAAVFLLVGGAAWNEWSRSQQQARAEALGDAVVAALELEDAAQRAAALQAIQSQTADGQAMIQLLIAAELVADDRASDALTQLVAVRDNDEVQSMYRQIATFKSLMVPYSGTSVEERQSGFAALISSGSTLRVLAEEQLALLDIELGNEADAVLRLERLLEDSEITQGVRRRVTQLITSLGATPGATSGTMLVDE
ncbi:MAG: hypothetical protein P8M25_17090 [Paracoccaceae bacterium]|nr:hypothetical protein [Paracoccaceae bacterium]